MSWRVGGRLSSMRHAPCAMRHALDGLWHVARTEPNMRIHLAAAAVAVGAGVWLKLDSEAWR